MKLYNTAKGVRRTTHKGRPCFRWQSIGTNGQSVIRRTLMDRPFQVNDFGYPDGVNSVEQVII